MSNTEKNLKEAFAGESQANRKYLAFAKKAEDEGFKQIARLFRAAAEAETVHAHNHLRELGGIKSTKENLEEAINGESYEFQKMYPQMIKDAEAEGIKGALRSFNFANEVEKIHAELYKKALENIGKNPRLIIMYARSAEIQLRMSLLMNARYAAPKRKCLKSRIGGRMS